MKKKLAGKILVDRRLASDPIMREPKRLAIYLYLAMTGASEQYLTNVHGIEVVLQPGEQVASREMLSDALEISDATVRRSLDYLKKRHLIHIRTVGGVSIIKSNSYTENLESVSLRPENSENDQTVENSLFPNKNEEISHPVNESEIEAKFSNGPITTNSILTNNNKTKEYISKDIYNSSPPEGDNGKSAVLASSEPKPKSDLRLVGEYFCAKWKERFGTNYIFQYGRDNASLKRLLTATQDPKRVASLIDIYFQDTDPFLLRCGYTVSMLERKANSYLIELRMHSYGG